MKILRSVLGVIVGGIAMTITYLVISMAIGTWMTHRAESAAQVQQPTTTAAPDSLTVVVTPPPTMASSGALMMVPAWLEALATAGAAIAAGYVAALIAGHADLVHGAMATWPIAVLAFFTWISPAGNEGVSLSSVAQLIAAPIAGALGGALRRRQRKDRS